MSDLVQKSVTDSSEQVSTVSKTLLVPAFGLWANEIGKLQLGVVNLFAKKITQIVNVKLFFLFFFRSGFFYSSFSKVKFDLGQRNKSNS